MAEDIDDINGDDSIEVGEFCNNVDVCKVNILSSHNDEDDNDDDNDDSRDDPRCREELTLKVVEE